MVGVLFLAKLGRLYVRHYNCRYTRSGNLFEGRFKACIVQEDRYFLTCLRYIECNPVRAGIVKDPGDYRWSSYRAHAFGKTARMWSPHDLYLQQGINGKQRQRAWRKRVSDAPDFEVLAKIRHCANIGLVLGTESLRDQVRKLRARAPPALFLLCPLTLTPCTYDDPKRYSDASKFCLISYTQVCGNNRYSIARLSSTNFTQSAINN